MEIQPYTRCYCMSETYQWPRVPQTFTPHMHRDSVIARCVAGPGIRRAWLSPSFHLQRYHRKCCCDPSKGMVAVSSISNSNPAWNPLLLPHPSLAFPVGPTHQVKPPQLLSNTCRLLLPNIWKVRAAQEVGRFARQGGMWEKDVGLRGVSAGVQSGWLRTGFGAWQRVMLEETRMGILVSIDLGSSEYLYSSRRFILLFPICRRSNF